jgi:hypothetical protein
MKPGDMLILKFRLSAELTLEVRVPNIVATFSLSSYCTIQLFVRGERALV